jgi:beta-aspartyl-peptidase (threonine type)
VTGAVLLASERGEIGLPEAMELLRSGGRAIDAVELAVRAAEANPDDHWVGVGGIPNLLGTVELDASIMDGRTRAAGAVGAVRGFPHPITIARKVLEHLPQHLLLVGEGAERFAREVGVEPGEVLTEEAQTIWRERIHEPSWDGAETEGDRLYRQRALELLGRLPPPQGPLGTVNVIALDRQGDLCVGVSTSGYPWKYPGRVGDSPIIGAGNYCDNRAGAAACTGRGELAIRAGTAAAVVRLLGEGRSPADACLDALRDTVGLADEFRAPLNALALTSDGRHGAATTRAGSTYAVLTESMSEPEICERTVL